jgi:hypothetical protein
VSREALALGLTFVLACGSATFFLLMRCEGKGRAFGPRSWRWALLVIVLTGALSTGGALALAALGHYALPAAVLSVGIAAPGALCLERIREGIPERRSAYIAAATLWLSWLLARMSEGMAEDKLEWCERRVDHAWRGDELIMAAHSYHDYLIEHLSDEDRKRYRIRALLQDAEARLDIAMLIDARATRSRVAAAIKASRFSREARYQRNLDDLTWLGDRLSFDARRDVERMLSAAYASSLYRLERYVPPARRAPVPTEPAAAPGSPGAPGAPGSPRWHP